MEEQNIRISKNQRGRAPTELPLYLQEVKPKHDKQVKRIFQLDMLRQRMSQPGTMVENKAKATGALGRLPLSQPPQTKRPTPYPQAPGRWKGFPGEPRPNTNTGAGGSAPGAGGGRCTTLHPHHGDSGSLLNTGPGSSRPL